MNPDRQFWADKKVLLTGHTGFKGSWLSLWLQEMGADLTGYSLEPPTNPSLFENAKVASGMRSIQGDICDLEHMSSVMAETEPDIVLHLAAQSLVRYSYDHPLETYQTNVMGTANVLEAVRRHPSARSVVCVTTDKCYENREWVWGYREDEPMGGFDPYSSSKGCAELLISAYRRSFFDEQASASVASARAGNVIGGGDWALDRLIPDIMRALLKEEEIVIRNPNSIRPWQHVIEPLSGYLLLAQSLFPDNNEMAQGWNFGPTDSDAKPVGWIVDQLTEQWGEGARWRLDGLDHPHEAQYLKLDISKAAAQLGYRPRMDLPTALDWTASWYKAFQEGADLRAITTSQIADFLALGTVKAPTG